MFLWEKILKKWVQKMFNLGRVDEIIDSIKSEDYNKEMTISDYRRRLKDINDSLDELLKYVDETIEEINNIK